MSIGIDKILKEIQDNVNALDSLNVDFDSVDNTHVMAALIMILKRVEVISRRIDILKQYVIDKDRELGGEELGSSG